MSTKRYRFFRYIAAGESTYQDIFKKLRAGDVVEIGMREGVISQVKTMLDPAIQEPGRERCNAAAVVQLLFNHKAGGRSSMQKQTSFVCNR